MNEIGIIPFFKGRGIHDMYASYFTYTTFEHGVCNAHIIRELTLAFEEYNQAWAEKLIQLLQKALRTVKSSIRKGNDSIDARTLAKYEERYMILVENGLTENPLATRESPHTRGKVKQSENIRVLPFCCRLGYLLPPAIVFVDSKKERCRRIQSSGRCVQWTTVYHSAAHYR